MNWLLGSLNAVTTRVGGLELSAVRTPHRRPTALPLPAPQKNLTTSVDRH